MNWRGRPLTSHEVIVDLIAATTTRTGLSVHAELDTASYPHGIKITDAADGPTPPTLAATTSTANGTTPSRRARQPHPENQRAIN